MKFPRLKSKDYTLIAIVAVAVLFIGQAIYRQREGFESRLQIDTINRKMQENGQQITDMFRVFPGAIDTREGSKGGFSLDGLFRYSLPLFAVGQFGNVKGPEVEIAESEIDDMLEGRLDPSTFGSKARQSAEFGWVFAMGELKTPEEKEKAIQATVNVANILQSVFAKGVCTNSDPTELANCQKGMADPNDKMNKPWSQAEKDALKRAAKMLYKVKSTSTATAGPSASSAPGLTAGTQSASCTQCSVVNGQISCACDVLPKA